MKTRRAAALRFAWAACLGLSVAGLHDPASAGSRAARGATAVEDSDPAVTWSGPWSTRSLAASSGGGARLTMEPGARATLHFTGTGVSWIGYRDEWCGVARVLLDEVLVATLDTYATPARARVTLHTISGLEPGAHTLAIEAAGTHDPAAAGSWVWVDAFVVTQAPPGEPSVRGERAHAASVAAERATPVARPQAPEDPGHFDQDHAAVSWRGTWSRNSLAVHAGGSARLSMEASARASFAFSGTGVRWIGYGDEWSGIAEVWLDGRLRASVDTHASPARPQVELYVVEGLAAGPHTLTIQPTGRHGPDSGGSWIWIDAFKVLR